MNQRWGRPCFNKMWCQLWISETFDFDRCPTFQAPHANCSLVADPKDPLCCKVPECPTDGNYNTAPPLVIQGGKATPGPTIMPTPYTPPMPNYTQSPVYVDPPFIFYTTSPPSPPVYFPPIDVRKYHQPLSIPTNSFKILNNQNTITRDEHVLS
jgi:hypothetical protein